ALVVYCDKPEGTSVDVGPVLDRLMSNAAPPSAVFAVNDGLALLVLQALRNKKLSDPEDLAVVGFDDLSSSAIVSPGLTTVHQPFRALGETAGHMILDRLSGRYSGPPRRVQLATKLVVRESCGISDYLRSETLACAV